MMTNPTLPAKSMAVQLRALVVDAFQGLESPPLVTPTVIIDGLDECQGHETQQLVLSLISEVFLTFKLPIRFIIGSRPEAHIRESFDHPHLHAITRRVVLDDSFNPNQDIALYLREGFAGIYAKNTHLMSQVEQPWPPAGVIDLLVQNASGQFIYAATILKFVGAEFFRPTKQLEIILKASPLRSAAFSDLDHLYTQILSVYPNPKAIVEILGILLALHCPQPSDVIEDILGVESGEVKLVFRGLHSLVWFPGDQAENFSRDDDAECKSGIRLHHASFQDYLVDKDRSGQFFIEISEFQNRLTMAGFALITSSIVKTSRHETRHVPSLNTWRYLKWHLAPHFSQCPDSLRTIIVQDLEAFTTAFDEQRDSKLSEISFDAFHCAITLLVVRAQIGHCRPKRLPLVF
ncbi:hypothetical protein B0H34DRAFT_1212 [Crassisporium funariophilum]|nr:hypothetical protein B0H34DRAFT_1212 [Crassisporium funariophilum]